jgi:collagenase-like PrtC family protease
MHRQPIFLPEALSPELSVAVVSRDQFRVAVRFAVDAVILPRDWPKELYETEIRFAHENNVRVYLDLGGPLSQSEIQTIKDDLAAYAYYAFDGLWIGDEGLLGYVSYVTPSLKIFYEPLRPLSNFSQLVFWQNQGVERILLSPPLIYSEIASFQKNSRIPLELLIYQNQTESTPSAFDLYPELKIIKETGVKSLRLDLRSQPIDLFAVQIKKYRQGIDQLYLVENLFNIEND